MRDRVPKLIDDLVGQRTATGPVQEHGNLHRFPLQDAAVIGRCGRMVDGGKISAIGRPSWSYDFRPNWTHGDRRRHVSHVACAIMKLDLSGMLIPGAMDWHSMPLYSPSLGPIALVRLGSLQVAVPVST